MLTFERFFGLDYMFFETSSTRTPPTVIRRTMVTITASGSFMENPTWIRSSDQRCLTSEGGY